MPQVPRICLGEVVENPGPTVSLYAHGDGTITFPRTSLYLSDFMASLLEDRETACFHEADLETVECIATYMRTQKYVCSAGFTAASSVPVSVAAFKAALNVVAYAGYLQLPDLVTQAEEYAIMAEDNLTYTLALMTMIDSPAAMLFSDLMPRIEETTQNIIKYAPPNQYGPLLKCMGVPSTLGQLYLMSILSSMAGGERKEEVLNRISESLEEVIPPAMRSILAELYSGEEHHEMWYDSYELADFTNEVYNADDEEAGVSGSRHARRARPAEQERLRPRELPSSKHARAALIRRKKNGGRY
ncbi:hypothetical protein ACHAP5_003848 [Fusarium lateritium]